jgi:hypothetical protein
MGRWRVRNRWLRRRLAGSDDWEEFDATSVARPLVDGMGNEDEFRTDHDGGFVGMSFRFFDPATRLWSIYWADSRRPGALDPPVFGSFSGDVGLFEGTDILEGRPILVRFTWSGVRTPTPAWEQALLRRRRRHLGDELGDGVHPGARRAVSARPARPMMTIEDVRSFALSLPRTTEALVGGRVKFRVGRIVYVAFSRDETVMGFAFPKEWRDALVGSEPAKFMLPGAADLRYNWVLVRLAAIDADEMRELVLDAWAMVVPSYVSAAYAARD